MPSNNYGTTTATPFAPTDILTPTELADRLKVKVGWVYEQMRPCRKNPLPVLHAGRLLRFSWAAVCAWLQGQPQSGVCLARTKKPSASVR